LWPTGPWEEHQGRSGVPAHRDQPPVHLGHHPAASSGADLLGLHQHSVADLDHADLLCRLGEPGPPSVPRPPTALKRFVGAAGGKAAIPSGGRTTPAKWRMRRRVAREWAANLVPGWAADAH